MLTMAAWLLGQRHYDDAVRIHGYQMPLRALVVHSTDRCAVPDRSL